MKKLIIFSLALLCYFNIANAQMQYNGAIIDKSTKHNLKLLFKRNLDPHVQLLKNKNLKLSKNIIWKCDTLITNDTLNGLLGRQIRTYDLQGNDLTQLIEEWQNNSWVVKYRYTFSYDINGNNNSILCEQNQNNNWINYSRHTYTYDTNRNRLTDLSEIWLTNVWENYSKITFTYDAYGNLLTDLEEEWNNSWVNSWRDTYTYDGNGNEILWIIERWSYNSWELISRGMGTYDINGKLLTYLYEDWLNNSWVNSSRYTYNYNTNGSLFTYISESWYNYGWLYSSRGTYTYDANENSYLGICEKWQNGQWCKNYGWLVLYSQQNYIYSLYQTYRYQAHYKSFTSGISEIVTNRSLFVFPNPATSNITVNCTSLYENKENMISVFNTQGQLLMQVPMQQENQHIDISKLARGVYFLKLNNSMSSEVVKVIKE